MNALAVVVISECLQLSRQVDRVPEKQAVQVLAPDRPDQALDEGMPALFDALAELLTGGERKALSYAL